MTTPPLRHVHHLSVSASNLAIRTDTSEKESGNSHSESTQIGASASIPIKGVQVSPSVSVGWSKTQSTYQKNAQMGKTIMTSSSVPISCNDCRCFSQVTSKVAAFYVADVSSLSSDFVDQVKGLKKWFDYATNATVMSKADRQFCVGSFQGVPFI